MAYEVDLAWAAGIFEGEGTVTIALSDRRAGGTRYLSLRVLLGNTDIDMLTEFTERWPAALLPRAATARHKASWTWVLYGRRAAAFLQQIEPFVRTGRMKDRIAVALEFQSQRVRGRAPAATVAAYMERQYVCRDRLTELNRKGPRGTGLRGTGGRPMTAEHEEDDQPIETLIRRTDP